MTSLSHSLELNTGGVISLVGAGGKTALMFRLARELSRKGDSVLTTTTTKIYIPNRRQSAVVMISESSRQVAKMARAVLRRNPHISAGSRIIHFQNRLIGFQPQIIDDIWQSATFRWIIVEADGAAAKPVKAPAFHEPVIPQCTKWVIGIVGLQAVGKPLNERWAFRPQLISKISGLAPGAAITESAITKLLVNNKNGILKNAPAQAIRFVFLNQADYHERLLSGRRIAQMVVRQQKSGFAGVLIGQTLYEPPVKEFYPNTV
jgi:probable selenium-dependent hydroxylase accessory protein YqeC